MKAQHKYSTASKGEINVTTLIGAALILLLGGLMTIMNRATSEQRSTHQAATEAPVALSARPATTNRLFQDEINAAAIPERSAPLSDFGTGSERRSVIRPVAVAPIRTV